MYVSTDLTGQTICENCGLLSLLPIISGLKICYLLLSLFYAIRSFLISYSGHWYECYLLYTLCFLYQVFTE